MNLVIDISAWAHQIASSHALWQSPAQNLQKHKQIIKRLTVNTHHVWCIVVSAIFVCVAWGFFSVACEYYFAKNVFFTHKHTYITKQWTTFNDNKTFTTFPCEWILYFIANNSLRNVEKVFAIKCDRAFVLRRVHTEL